MAETGAKRNNAGGKAPMATPKSPLVSRPAATMTLEDALSGAIGSSIHIQTSNPNRQTLEGTLFTICPLTNLLAVSTAPPNPVHHIIPISSIEDFTLTSSPTTPLPSLTPLSTSALQARADKALADAKLKAAKINKNVSREAQEIFDAFSRQYATRWEGKDIVVMDHVIVKGPGYKPEDCRAGKDAQAGSLPRIKKVLENERKRLAQRESKGPKPVVPAVPAIPAFTGQRKGG